MTAVAWLMWLAVVGSGTYRLAQRAAPPAIRFLLPALLVKLACGLLLGWLYLHVFGGGDTFRFFSDGVRLARVAQFHTATYLSFLWDSNDSFAVWHQLVFTEPRSLFYTKMLSIVCLAAGNSYWLCALWLSYAAFVCAWLLVNRLSLWYPQHTVLFAIAFLFWPSVVFWSGGVLKEAVALAALLWMVRVVLDGVHGRRYTVGSVVQLCFCLWIAWNLKYYWVGLLAPCLLVMVGSKHPQRWRFAAGAIGVMALVMAFHPNFFPSRLPAVVVENYQQYHFLTGGNNTFRFSHLTPDWAGVLLSSPAALFSGLFRPFLWECTTFFHVLAALENLVLLGLTLATLLRFHLPSPLRGWLLPLVVYALAECTWLTLATPSWGTLTRYRVGMLPFFVLFVLLANAPLQQFLKRRAN